MQARWEARDASLLAAQLGHYKTDAAKRRRAEHIARARAAMLDAWQLEFEAHKLLYHER